MAETGGSGKKKSGSKTVLYAVLGVVFLFLVAITSSIDVSFVYICTGFSTFFFFLAARDWLGNRQQEPGTGNYNRSEARREEASKPSSSDSWQNIFKTQPQPASQSKPQNFSQPGAQQVPDPKKKMTKVGCIAFIIGASFFGMIFISIIFGSEDEGDKMFFNSIAQSYYDRNEYDSAAINYRSALKIDPDDEESQMGYGKVLLFGLQQYDSALIMFNKAAANNPNNMEAVQHRGLTYYYQKKYNEGIDEAVFVLENNPTHSQAMLLAGDCYYELKDLDNTILWYQKAYDLGERGMNLAWNMAYIYDTKGNTSKAIDLYKQVLEYDTSKAVVEIYRRLGELVPGDEGNKYRTRAAELRQGQ